MNASAVGRVCGVVKSASVFPELLPGSPFVVAPVLRHANLALAKAGAACKQVLASVPQCDCFVFTAMILLATA